jgi:hypothetical protein
MRRVPRAIISDPFLSARNRPVAAHRKFVIMLTLKLPAPWQRRNKQCAS